MPRPKICALLILLSMAILFTASIIFAINFALVGKLLVEKDNLDIIFNLTLTKVTLVLVPPKSILIIYLSIY